MGWRLKPESDERALIAALRALVEAEDKASKAA